MLIRQGRISAASCVPVRSKSRIAGRCDGREKVVNLTQYDPDTAGMRIDRPAQVAGRGR